MLNWAVERGHIGFNPVATLKRPKRKRRDVCYRPEEWNAIMRHATGPLIDFLRFMEMTGCRRVEARIVEARHICDDQVIYEFKNSKGQIERRVIFLVEEAKAILERLSLQQKSGPLFRNAKGNP